MCRSLPDYISRETSLSLVRDGARETLFSSKKRKKRSVCLTFCSRERVQDETRVFFLLVFFHFEISFFVFLGSLGF